MKRVALVVVALGLVVAASIWWKSTRREDSADAAAAAPKRTQAQAPMRAPRQGATPRALSGLDRDPVGRQRLEGQVIDTDDHPVSGATVVIDANPRREVSSEADGSFAFQGLVARTFTLEAHVDDLVAGPVAVRLTASSEPVILRVAPAATVAVAVEDMATGTAIAGAQVELRGLAIVASLTGADGIALLRGVPARELVLKVSAPGYAVSFSYVNSSGAPGSMEKKLVRLRRGVAVSGRVVNLAGEPIEGARVTVEDASSLFEPADPQLDAAVSDAKGRWFFTALPPVAMRFGATHARYAPGHSSIVAVTEGAGQENVTIALERGGSIGGKVVTRDGAPVGAAAVLLGTSTLGRGPIRRTHCDQDGRFEMVGLPRKVLHVVAVGDEASSELYVLNLAAKPDQLDLSLVLDTEGVISGTVVASDGKPVPEARVRAELELQDSADDRSEARLRGEASDLADSGGSFRLTGLKPGVYRVRAVGPTAPLESLWHARSIAVRTGAAGVEIVLQDEASVSGKVQFDDGTSPDLFTVTIGVGTPRPFSTRGGQFALPGIPPGAHVLKVSGPSIVSKLVNVELDPGESEDLGVITLRRGRSVSGLVVNASGGPVEGAVVVGGAEFEEVGDLFTPSGERLGVKKVISGADGSYVLAGIGNGAIILAADHEVHGRARVVSIPAGRDSAQVDLVLEEPGALEGRVTVDGAPAEGIVGLRSKVAADAGFMTPLGADGTFRKDRLAPGPYIAFAYLQRGSRLGGGGSSAKSVVIESGQTTRLDFEITRGKLDVSVRVESPGDDVNFGYAILIVGVSLTVQATITEARARMANLGDGQSHEGFMVENRQITFQGVPPGQHTACVVPMSGDPNDPAVFARFSEDTTGFMVYCQPVTVAPSPTEQVVTVRVPGVPNPPVEQ